MMGPRHSEDGNWLRMTLVRFDQTLLCIAVYHNFYSVFDIYVVVTMLSAVGSWQHNGRQLASSLHMVLFGSVPHPTRSATR